MSLTFGSDPRTLFVAEPPAQYLIRPPIVIDCSVLAGLVFEESWQLQAIEKIQGRTLNAPYLLQTEIASVALKKYKKGAVDIAKKSLAHYATLLVELHRVYPADSFALAVRYNLSAYDASYLWLAAELKAPLATFDEKLAAAAQTHLAGLP
jgi:predicted nucleic acid-binding protein